MKRGRDSTLEPSIKNSIVYSLIFRLILLILCALNQNLP